MSNATVIAARASPGKRTLTSIFVVFTVMTSGTRRHLHSRGEVVHTSRRSNNNSTADRRCYLNMHTQPSPDTVSTVSPRVITDSTTYPALQQQPQCIYHSAPSISTVSSQEIAQLYGASLLSPHNARTYMTSDELMQNTPPRSPHSPRMMAFSMSEQLSRKRPHDAMSGSNTIANPVDSSRTHN